MTGTTYFRHALSTFRNLFCHLLETLQSSFQKIWKQCFATFSTSCQSREKRCQKCRCLTLSWKVLWSCSIASHARFLKRVCDAGISAGYRHISLGESCQVTKFYCHSVTDSKAYIKVLTYRRTNLARRECCILLTNMCFRELSVLLLTNFILINQKQINKRRWIEPEVTLHTPHLSATLKSHLTHPE